MEYLENTLKIKVEYTGVPKVSLPRMLTARYALKTVLLENMQVVFCYAKMELDQLTKVKNHMALISKAVKMIVVLVTKDLTARQRDALIAAGIPFIYPNKQIYLPFMGIVLQERFKAMTENKEKLSPSAQVMLFYYLYQKKEKLFLTELKSALNFSSMTLSRASKELENLGILKTGKDKVQKYIWSDKSLKEIYEYVKDYLINPVKRTVYVDAACMEQKDYIAGDSALAEYSMINEPKVKVYATYKLDTDIEAMEDLIDESKQAAVQLWAYNPGLLTANGVVDRLSLACSYSDEDDDRINIELEEMLDNMWENGHGKGF